MKNALSIYWKYCFLLLSLLIVAEAVSQNQPSEKKQEIKELNEVLVNGNSIEKRKKEESLNVETVNNSFIQRNLGGSLMQSLQKLPGVKTISIGSGGSKPLIRGLSFNQVIVVENGLKHDGQQWGADHGLSLIHI